MRAKKSIVVALLLCLGLLTASAAYADPARYPGYPAAALVNVSTPDISLNFVVLMKFAADSSGINGFTADEAQLSSEQLGALVAPVIGIITSQLPSADVSSVFVTPSDLEGWSADEVADVVADNYLSWGYDAYLFLDINRVSGVSGAFVPVEGLPNTNARVDLWLGDAAGTISWLLSEDITPFLAAIGVAGDYLYIVSLEVPETYWLLLGALMSGL
ncbi:MAG: hypothetical protein HZB33_04125 [Nitrospirae bacterium]|nr:hypothetical protein [Nitrospirota bacterium]